ncbi:hypothetical protein GGS21DRAFT_241554 [Xylaria nigripes]|nr:hypothetical protein GGS21DRAFT_241554 [Xylaria nigripes]
MPAPTTDNMSPAEQALALQKVHELEKKTRQTKTSEFIQDVKQSTLFQPGYNWNDLLSAAPLCITLLGNLFVASTTPEASQITIIAPSDGFKTLRQFDVDPSLHACLIQCADTGAKAFGIAATAFDAIALKSATVQKTSRDIIEILGDQEATATTLRPTIQILARVAKDCEAKAKEIDQAFVHWLDMVCEIHMCVAQTSTSVSAKRYDNETQLAAAKTKLAGATEAKKNAAETVECLKKSLDTATKAYKKASDDFPSGWDLVAQQFVNDLSHSLTNAFNLAIPALIENYSATAKIEKGVNIFTGLAGGVKGGSADHVNQDHSAVTPATQTANPVPKATLPYPNDPAYGVIGLIRHNVSVIQAFVTGGPDKGVDWNLLQSTDPKKTKNGLGVIASLLEDYKADFKPSDNPPSQTLTRVFNGVLEVTTALQDAIKANKAVNGAPLPKADSEKVIGWQKTLAKAVTQATVLNTECQTATTTKAPPSINPTQTNSTPSDQQGAFRKQILDAAANRLETTAKVLETTTDSFQKAGDRLVDVQLKIANIQADISKLKADSINLEHIKAVLIKSIEILVQLKTQISKLVAFFSAVSTLVDHVVDDQVQPFIEYLNAFTGGPERSILNFSFTDFQRQLIFGFSLSIRAYFELFQDISAMYRKIDNDYIRDGLKMVNEMQVEYGSISDKTAAQKILDKKMRAVSDFNVSAVQGVKNVIKQKQDEIMGNLETNARVAADDVKFLPARPPTAVSNAITSSTEESKQRNTKAIAQSGKYISHPFSSTNSLLD